MNLRKTTLFKDMFNIRLLLLMLNLVAVAAVTVDSTTQQFINKSISDYEALSIKRCKFPPDIIPLGEKAERSSFFLPDLIIWCPITTYHLLIKCPQHGVDLCPRQWMSTAQISRQPRLLYGTNGNCLLIGRLYLCQAPYETHRIRSTDPDILKSLPLFVHVPFVLTHRSGCSREFLTFLCTQISQGSNFHEIRRAIEEIQYDNLVDRFVRYSAFAKHQNENVDQVALQDIQKSDQFGIFGSPSVDLLISFFLEYFETNRWFYEKEMSMTEATWISMDHTFRISRNIGIERQIDHKWIQQYDCLFLVMNELGQIVTWSLTKGTAFSEVETFLERFRDRLAQWGKSLQFAVTDNCCQWKTKLQSVFGPGLNIKLDLFHAIKRLTNTIPKKGTSLSLRRMCIADFSLVFRESKDTGARRENHTPNPQVLLKNLDNFVKLWGLRNDSLLNEQSMHAIDNIRLHMQRGCLSGIPPGCGTERNENLHRYINRSVISGATHIGPELAFALLTVLFYGHNLRAAKKSGNWYFAKTLFALENLFKKHANYPNNEENFGFAKTSDNQNVLMRGWMSKDNLKTGHDKLFNGVVLDHSRAVDQVSELLTSDICEYIIQRFYNYVEIYGNFRKYCVGKDSFQMKLFMDYGNSPQTKYFLHGSGLDSDKEVVEHKDRLLRHLSSLNLHIEEVERDGDCLFRSVCLQIRKQMQNGAISMEHQLLELSNSFYEELKAPTLSLNCIYILRQLFVTFAIENLAKYLPFLNLDITLATLKLQEFKRHGVFSGEVGDIVVTVLSDLLRCPIIVVSSLESVPIIPFIPDQPVHHQPLYIAYNQSGPGHYDSTKPNEEINNEIDKSKQIHLKNITRCSCGKDKVKKNPDFKSCTNADTTKYKTRCPCFKANVLCSSKTCKCVNCYNGKPTSIPKHSKPLTTRKRKRVAKHKKTSGLEFLTQQNENLLQGTWTDNENHFLECILITMELFPNVSSTVQNVHALYDFICSSDLAVSTELPVRRKTPSQIQGKLEKRKELSFLFSRKIEQQLHTRTNRTSDK